jgi:hypothetical protein
MNKAVEDPRRSPRAKVLLSATLEFGGRALPVKLRDLSEHGALVAGAGLPPDDRDVLLRRNDLCVAGFVAWNRDGFAGISFTTSLRPEVVMQHVKRRAHRPVEEPVHRRPGVTQRGMTAEERRWFDEMNGEPARVSRPENVRR